MQSSKNQMMENSKSSTFKEKENLIMKVINYQSSPRFGAFIKKDLKFNYNRDQLAKKSLEQLEHLLYRIRNFLNVRQMNGMYEQMVRTTAVGYEDLVSTFYPCHGFSDMLLNNPSFWDAFERWKLERELPDIPPSFQIAYIVASTTVLAHMKNEYDQSKKSDYKPKQKDTNNNNNTDIQQKPQKTQLRVGGTIN